MRTLEQSAQKLGIDLSTEQLAQFGLYQQELLLWNAKTNLISEKSAQKIVRRHFLDSLSAFPFIVQQDARIVDIGCGAGFPGIPLKIVLPALRLYLLETNRKKVSFLKHIIRRLNLPETVVLHERVENLLKITSWKNFFNILISRAAFKLPEMLPFGGFFIIPGGRLIALKAKDLTEEFSQAQEIAQQHGFYELFQHDINQEDPAVTRKIIVAEKTK